MTITEIKENESIRLSLEGSIDRNSSSDFMNSVTGAFKKTKALVIDMEKVTYISSAGLRVFVIGQKTASNKGGSFSIINVSDNVFEVFHSTGFDRAFDIRKLNR